VAVSKEVELKAKSRAAPTALCSSKKGSAESVADWLTRKAIGKGKQGGKTRGYRRPRAPLTLLIDEAQQRLGVIHPACQAPFGGIASR